MPPALQPPSRRSELWHGVRDQWWMHLLIASALTVLLRGGLDSATEVLVLFGANLLLSVCIGTSISVVYVLGWGTVLIEGSVVRRGLAHGISIAAGVVVGTELALLLLRLTALVDVRVGIPRTSVYQVGAVIAVVATLGSITVDRLRERVRTVELREHEARQALLRAQLDSLQSRVNPHFLFNALNTVASLVEDDPDAAVDAIERLSALLRYSLEGARRGRVALGRELEAVRSYLALERLRFDDRLRAEVRVEPGLESVVVPPFVLQPLVENAVKHGIAPRRAGGQVVVSVEADHEHLRLRVEDDGPGSSAVSGTQIGHDDLRRRLALLYGDRARFEAGPRPEGGYRVQLVLPRGGMLEVTTDDGPAMHAASQEVAAS